MTAAPPFPSFRTCSSFTASMVYGKNMVRNLRLAYFFWFLPFPILALSLNQPTRSSNGKKVQYTWTGDPGDPSTVTLGIYCYPVPFFPIYDVNVALQHIEVTADPKFSMRTSSVPCFVKASLSHWPFSVVGELGNSFTSLEVSPAITTKATTQTLHLQTVLTTASADPTKPNASPPPQTQSPSKNPTSSSKLPSPATPQLPDTWTSQMAQTLKYSNTPTKSSSQTTSPVSTTPMQSHRATSDAFSRGAIVGIVVASLVILILFLTLAFLYYRRRKNYSAPSTAYRSDNENAGFGPIGNVRRQMKQFLSDEKRGIRHDISEDRTRLTEQENSMRRKSEIIRDLEFEDAVRAGVKA